MRRAAPWTTAVAVACVAGACSGDGRIPTAEVIDSAGVRIVSYDLTEVPIPTYRTLAPHDLEIGTLDGAPEYTFSSIPDLALTGDGSIVVSDGVTQELRLYDADGSYVRTLGRRGEGPGEFSSAPMIAGLADDTAFVFDVRTVRVTSFGLEGELIETTSLRTDEMGRPQSVIRQDDGTYLLRSRWVAPGAEDELYDVRMELDSIVIEHVDASGTLIDTVRVMADRSRVRRVQSPSPGIFRVQQANVPYPPRAFVRSDGLRAVMAYSDVFELELQEPAGNVGTILRVLGVQHPATADDIRAVQEARLREELGGGEIDPNIRRLNLDFLPDRLPAFASVRISDEGDIWVALTEYDASGGYDWLVFTPTGELRGVVHTPPDLQLFAMRADHIVGVFRDGLDVPYVRRYPLVVESREGG
jgi:hypothetical protein